MAETKQAEPKVLTKDDRPHTQGSVSNPTSAPRVFYDANMSAVTVGVGQKRYAVLVQDSDHESWAASNEAKQNSELVFTEGENEAPDAAPAKAKRKAKEAADAKEGKKPAPVVLSDEEKAERATQARDLIQRATGQNPIDYPVFNAEAKAVLGAEYPGGNPKKPALLARLEKVANGD